MLVKGATVSLSSPMIYLSHCNGLYVEINYRYITNTPNQSTKISCYGNRLENSVSGVNMSICWLVILGKHCYAAISLNRWKHCRGAYCQYPWFWYVLFCFVLVISSDNAALVKWMVWHHTDNKPLLESMLNKLLDVTWSILLRTLT